jgi:outer membrane protein insertion porin family
VTRSTGSGQARAALVCLVIAASAGVAAADDGPAWTEWKLQGELLEPEATVRALLATTMDAHRTIDGESRTAIATATETIGYHLIGLGSVSEGGKTVAVLSVAPIPVVRSVTVDVDQDGFLNKFLGAIINDEIERRIRLRPGARLPWDPQARTDALRDEEGRIQEYLRDEGFFEATARVRSTVDGKYGARITVDADLGPEYKTAQITVDTGGGQGVSPSEIRGAFVRQKYCIVWRLCFGDALFSRTRHTEALAQIVNLYRKRGYPAVRVQSSFDPRTSFDRKSKTVRFTVRVDERRQIDVVFEGNEKSRFPDETLRKQLTFDEAQSSDDFEAASSAAAIAAYYQSKSRFDAQVTWSRERFSAFDRIVFRIDEGVTRQVKSVVFNGNSAVPASALAGVISTKKYQSIRVFAANSTATAQALLDDAEAIRRAYGQRGYLEARVDVHASPDKAALHSAARTGAMVAAARHAGDLHVQFDIVEGPRTDVKEIRLVVVRDPARSPAPTEPLAPETCDAALDELGKRMGAKLAEKHALPDGNCAATLTDFAYDEDKLRTAGDALRDWFWAQGRPRSGVQLDVDRASVARHQAVLVYSVALGAVRKVGKVVVRGNFHTQRRIILDELGFEEGVPLTSSMLAQGPRAVRSTGLFEAVNVELLDLDAASDAPVNAVVRVEERYDVRMQFEMEGGYSTQNGVFGKVKAAVPNLSGTGIYTDAAVTLGSKFSAFEVSGRIPRWLTARAFPTAFDTELTGYVRAQDTDRFGRLTTQGASIGATRTWQRGASEKYRPYLLAASLRYDFRLRNRDEDALRPAGVDADQEKVPVATRTGSLGMSLRFDTRRDHRGQYNPLAAERGGLVEATVSFASPYLLGQDTFIKASLMGQRFWPVGDRIVFRTDLRVDEGFPLGDSVLLPEVERFFAGGDNTVRGFDEDRLATEIIQTGVPPLDGLEQIRILPAGGNIRAVASIDGQLILVDRWLASALFIDAGMVRNRWSGIEPSDIRPGVGAAMRVLTPFGTITVEYAFPLFPHLGDDPSGRIHFGLAFRQ